MSDVKKQLAVLLAYLTKRGPDKIAELKTQSASVSSLVSTLLDEWKNLPEGERKKYEEASQKTEQ